MYVWHVIVDIIFMLIKVVNYKEPRAEFEEKRWCDAGSFKYNNKM